MKTITGTVVSNKMVKTIVVEIKRQKVHPLYKKIMKRTSRVKVHTDREDLQVGDAVKIISTKPISKEKHFKFVSKI